jgi:hypothetical protein
MTTTASDIGARVNNRDVEREKLKEPRIFIHEKNQQKYNTKNERWSMARQPGKMHSCVSQ